MAKPKLYLFIGYPGAGKTTVAQIIAEETGAKHLWADSERHKLFPEASHSEEESKMLYDQLNHAAEYLLGQGKSVIYDTNFNFYSDRQNMQDLADKCDAESVLVWINTSRDVAKDRAVHAKQIRNGYKVTMSPADFDAIANKLEEPKGNEDFIKLDGTNLDDKSVRSLLKL